MCTYTPHMYIYISLTDSLMALALGSNVDPSSAGAGRGGGGDGGAGGADVYPLFYIRYVGMMLSTPLLLENLCVLAGGSTVDAANR